MKKVVDIVTKFAEPVAEKHGCEIWDVEFVKEGGQWFLRVYIDKDGGITIEDCEAVSRELDVILDKEDPIDESYVFEVSSAGADRQLKRPSDFEKFMGSNVYVKLYGAKDGQKEFRGVLKSYNTGDIELDVNGKAYAFEKKDIAIVRLDVIF